MRQIESAADPAGGGTDGDEGAMAGVRRGALFPLDDGYWLETHDADPVARRLYRRHYSCRHYRDGRIPKKFVGPGEHIVLVTPDGLALFVWRKFISDDGQNGVNCAVFRNEGRVLSSTLIREAEKLAWRRWPGERLYTYVNPRKIRSTNPGFCFIMAGWRRCGKTRHGLIILEKWPNPEGVNNRVYPG